MKRFAFVNCDQTIKKRFAAQQMVMLLGSLAHNLLVWSRRWLTPDAPRLAKYGALRIVRDLFHIPGLLEFSEAGRMLRITLNEAAPLVGEIALALSKAAGRRSRNQGGGDLIRLERSG